MLSIASQLFCQFKTQNPELETASACDWGWVFLWSLPPILQSVES
ncbi:MAG: hypothetical protein JWQ04_1191 [Pedosphaera sp.]|nr:hypothetical protein [Pedosphaera sp.]